MSYIAGLQLRPYPHQCEILDELAAERAVGHTRNLVVSATGTGKTVTAALDFKRLHDAEGPLSLLFVAHRKEILNQSLVTFRIAMSDAAFGELLVDGRQPDEGRHVFASVQSLHAERLGTLSKTAFDVVIVDEFHHAAAPTYARLLEHLEPRYLLGLTATPERTDGRSVLSWFEGRIASEIRLWKALDRGLLVPFAYFGVGDSTDLSAVTFRRGSYDRRQLQDVLTGDTARALRVRQAVERYVTDPRSMRALGFCVGLAHAELMANAFDAAGLTACAVAGNPPRNADGTVRAPFLERSEALRRLRDGALRCIFAVDLFNEGVDVPSVDTLLFLRPTESATLFLQQLGRGLRHASGKSHVTVLDFIGNANRRYRFDLKFRALTGGSRRALMDQVERGFPSLPPGCDITLDRVAQEHVLTNIKAAIGSSELRFITEELREASARLEGTCTLGRFLHDADLGVDDLYSRTDRSWTDYQHRAGLLLEPPTEAEASLLRSMARVQHVGDPERLDTWLSWLRATSPPTLASLDTRTGRLQLMLLAAVVDRTVEVASRAEAFERLWSAPLVRAELIELFEVLRDRTRLHTHPDPLAPEVPLRVHATYALSEIMAGYAITKRGKLYAPREGVYWHAPDKTDLFFITLNKHIDDYSPRTLYNDYPISQHLFHWESQANTRASSPTGKRYIQHHARGTHVVLFVREFKKLSGLTQPYLCLGKARYVRHQSERPMQIVWELERPMPAAFYQDAKTAAG